MDLDLSPFSAGRGRGVRVAVIDSGVNPRHPHIHSIAGGISIEGESETECDYLDFLGHGTAVMAAIQEKAPEAEYFAVKLFQTSLSARAACLLKAIDWSIERRVDIINLSLATSNPGHTPALKRIVERALECGIVLVSAHERNGQPSLPGSLRGVMGVRLDWSCARNSYRVEETDDGPVFYASGYPRPLPGVPLERNLYGISFAVANMTGFIARACELLTKRSPDAIRNALSAEALRLSTPASG